MKLYEITEAMVDTLDIFLESDRDEMDQEFYQESMELLKEELSNKSSNIIKYLRNLDAEAIAIKDEVDRLTKAKKSRERKSKSLKEYLVNTMVVLDKTKIESDLGTYGLRKSHPLEILDMSKIPEEFIKRKEEISVDKRAVSAYIKSGHDIEGAALVEKYSLQIR